MIISKLCAFVCKYVCVFKVSHLNHTECNSTHDAIEGALHGVVEFHGVVLQDGGLVAGRDVILGIPVSR